MVLFKSPHPHIDIPTDITTWEWAFESKEHSPLYNNRASEQSGAYIDAITKEQLDWRQVKEKSTLLSTVLVKKYGLRPNQTVSLFSTNTIWYPVAMWAVIRAGGRVNGASPSYTVDEMAFALKTAKSTILMTLPTSVDAAVAAAEKAGISRDRVFLLQGQAEGFLSIQQLMEMGKSYTVDAPSRIPQGQNNREVCGFLNFSSGTTGLPKAVMLSHHNIIAQCMQLKQLQAPDPDRYKILAVMPLFHITGLVRFCTYPIYMNGYSIMLPSFTLASMIRAIVEYHIKELILVPPVLIRLVRDDKVVEPYLPQLRRCVERWSSGSAPIAPEIIQELQRKFPDTGFRQGYGATESTACISCHPPTHYSYRYAATGGMPVANTDVKVISLTDPSVELGPNETGEILARGPQIAMGYLDNPSATAESFDADGFLHTGDVGHVDSLGLIHVEDRIKEMIKVKGLQVPPAELEDLLLGHPDVEDCAVIGIKDDYAGERPKAFVVLKKDPATPRKLEETGKMLLDFVRSRKVRYKWLVEVEFVDTVPKSPTGKLLRRVLKQRQMERGGADGSGIKVREDTPTSAVIIERPKL